MFITCLDLEGVLTPEIWINIAENTGIQNLKITTRDEPDYDKLMKMRIKILQENNIDLEKIQEIINGMKLLEGAREFINWLQKITEVIILTDSFIQFIKPLKQKLGNPTIFCHSLVVNDNNMITDYNLRIKNMKQDSVKKLKDLNFNVIAIGDSYNDINMLKEADYGILFKPPLNLIKEFREFIVANNYPELKKNISSYLGK